MFALVNKYNGFVDEIAGEAGEPRLNFYGCGKTKKERESLSRDEQLKLANGYDRWLEVVAKRVWTNERRHGDDDNRYILCFADGSEAECSPEFFRDVTAPAYRGGRYAGHDHDAEWGVGGHPIQQ